MPAHQAAFRLFKGEPLGVVRHTCDNPWCVNPEHLVDGTQADNVQDMHERGRANHKANRKLTMEEAQYIRESSELGKDLAKRFGVGVATISRIKHGLRYVK